MVILDRNFYKQDTTQVAKDLLGKIIVHETPKGVTAGKIVETEAYLGPEDQAAHSSGGRRSKRNEAMYGEKGHAYIYFIYGMYFCFNVTTGQTLGKPEAVLLRALEPVAGYDLMSKRRGTIVNLTNGPSRLCIAMGLTKLQNQSDLTLTPLYIKDAPIVSVDKIVEAPRIGVDYAGDWRNLPLRFYIRANAYVSVSK